MNDFPPDFLPGLPPDFPLVNGNAVADAGDGPANHGELSVVVWPPYIGLATTGDHNGAIAAGEPFEDINYARGQIMWRTTADDRVLGAARIVAPAGVYSHLVFFCGPGREHPLMGDPQQLEHPVVFDRPGFIDVDPIANQDYLPRICG